MCVGSIIIGGVARLLTQPKSGGFRGTKVPAPRAWGADLSTSIPNGGVCVGISVLGGVIRRRNVGCGACRRGAPVGTHSPIKAKNADVRRHKRNGDGGSGGSGIRRVAFGSIHIHIRRGGCGQRPGSGCRRRCGVARNTPANVREKRRYAPGSGRDGRNRNRICVNLHANAGRGGRSRRGTGDGIHSCTKERGRRSGS